MNDQATHRAAQLAEANELINGPNDDRGKNHLPDPARQPAVEHDSVAIVRAPAISPSTEQLYEDAHALGERR